jgi:AcrR family transcriptional regulator
LANIRNNRASVETRRRLIEAAGEVFAERGYSATTIREICSRAGANGAAVNYHFRDKAELYDTVLRYAHCAAQAEFTAATLPEDGPADQRLAQFVHDFMLRMLDEGRPAWHGKLMSRETTEPTDAMQRLIEESWRPRFELLVRIVRDLLGPKVDDLEVHRSAASVMGQCLLYSRCRSVVTLMHPWARFDRAGIEDLARHITDFSLRSMVPPGMSASASPFLTAVLAAGASDNTRRSPTNFGANSV